MALTGGLGFRTTAPRARAMYRPPTWRLAFIRRGTPLQPAGRRRALSQARHPRRAGPIAEGSSSGPFGYSPGSYTGCHRAPVSQRGCRRPPGVARSPSGGPSGRRQVSHNHLRSAALRPRWCGSPEKSRLRRRSGSVRALETLWLFGAKGRSFWRVPSLGPDRSLHLLNSRPEIQSSTVKWDAEEEAAGVGRGGHRPYIETNCRRPRKTTTHSKDGAQGAQTPHSIESNNLIVGRYRNPHDAHGCPCAKWVLDSSWTPVATFWWAGKR